MAKDHWIHEESDGHGCQHSHCQQPATVQHQRESTPEEVASIRELYRRTGIDHRTGSYSTAVFSCDEHALPPSTAWMKHRATCPAPDPGCVC